MVMKGKKIALTLLGLLVLAPLCAGCASQAYVRSYVKDELSRTSQNLKSDISVQQERIDTTVMPSLKTVHEELIRVREDLALLRKSMIADNTETKAELDRIGLRLGQLNVIVTNAQGDVEQVNQALVKMLEAQKKAIDCLKKDGK
jgi:TolA-binding protein